MSLPSTLARARVDASSRASLPHLLPHARVRRRRGRREQVSELHDARPLIPTRAARADDAARDRSDDAWTRDDGVRWRFSMDVSNVRL